MPFCSADLIGACISFVTASVLMHGKQLNDCLQRAADVPCAGTVTGSVAAFWVLQEYFLHAKALHSDFDWFGELIRHVR